VPWFGTGPPLQLPGFSRTKSPHVSRAESARPSPGTAPVLAFVNTHACVRATAVDAYQRDLEVIIPREAVGSYDREHAAVSLRYMHGKIASVVSVAQCLSRVR
jgi:isochorismate hydrolase